MSLEDYLKGRSDRCPGCGFHVATQGCDCPSPEWNVFELALRSSVRDDGTVHVNDVRPKIRGHIAPQNIGKSWRRARALKLIRFIDGPSGWEESTDTASRNADKLARIYAWRGSSHTIERNSA